MIEVMDRMTRNINNERIQLNMLTIDQMVPEDHKPLTGDPFSNQI
ncbi:hypothetical protein [Lysinibacillus sphaericus]